MKIYSFLFLVTFFLGFSPQSNSQENNTLNAPFRIENLPDNISLAFEYEDKDGDEIQREDCFLLWDIKNKRVKSIKLFDIPEEKSCGIYVQAYLNGIFRATGGLMSYKGFTYDKSIFFSPSWELKKTRGSMLILPSTYENGTNNHLFHSLLFCGGIIKPQETSLLSCRIIKTANVNGFVIPTELCGERKLGANPTPEDQKKNSRPYHIKVDVKSIKINQQLDDKMFELRIPVGANVIDDIKGITYRATGLDDDKQNVKLGEVLEGLIKEAEAQKGTTKQETKTTLQNNKTGETNKQK